MSDPLATSFDTLVGALAAASAALGRPVAAETALVQSGRAFRLPVDEHLRVIPATDAEVREALAGLGLAGEPVNDPRAIAAHEGPLLVWGLGGNVYGVALRREGADLVARSPLVAGEMRVPLARLAGAKVAAVVVRGLVDPTPPRRADIARDELAHLGYPAWARALATHPLSRIDPEGLAWTLARASEALTAAATVVSDEALARERALLDELRALFPLPDGGGLGSDSMDRGAQLLREAHALRQTWLGKLAAS